MSAIDFYPNTGWDRAGETWVYSSADSPSFVYTVAGDVSAKYTPGQKVKLTQTTVKYFIITKVSYATGTTTITVYGGTDYTLANAMISDPYWSAARAPSGFPLDPSKWTVSFTDSSRRNASGTTANTWYNPASLSFDLPIGVWNFTWFGIGYVARASAAVMSVQVAMSPSSSDGTDPDLIEYWYEGTLSELVANCSRTKTLVLTSKTTYYPLLWGAQATITSLAFLNDFRPMVCRAVCAYL
jgi:hypothetical protein